ncbi:MAG: hypothetical protein U1E86_06210 [Burkholderiaceae bacterium]
MPNDDESFGVPLNPGEVVELQDQLLEAATDLDRLSGLLEDAAAQLLARFTAASERIGADAGERTGADALRHELAGAVTALQFQDMATQVITHTVRRIRGVADFLGTRVSPDEEDGASIELVRRHCPVAQRQVDAGSIELF